MIAEKNSLNLQEIVTKPLTNLASDGKFSLRGVLFNKRITAYKRIVVFL